MPSGNHIRVGSNIMYGNRELALADLLRLTQIAGSVGEDDEDEDALFFRFAERNYTAAEVREVAEIIARMQPDECEYDGEALRLWWH